ncbi:MAG: hypothetical protein Q8Q22_00825 [bacterium]|nr:hypothetical protein [bacterium]MDZ4205607.1 hypothetical protein [Patescibacteria group bacterium]
MKIVSRGRVLNSREFYEKKKKRRYIQLILLFVVFISVISLLVYFSRQKRFQIVEVAVLGENVVDKEELAQIVRRELIGRYLWVVPRANTLIYPRRAIERGLLEKFTRLKSVNLNLDEYQRLLITVDERVPFALYCTNASNPQDASNCFFLDEEGFIFAPAPSFSSGVYFVYVTEDPVENPVGKRFITIEKFGLLSKFINTFVAFNIDLLALEIKDDEYTLLLVNGGQIMWRRDSDLALIHSNLEAFLSDDSIRAQSNFFDRMLYLDLRAENKVFYKFRE